MRNWLWIVALVLIGVGILVFPCTGPRKMIVATVLIFLVLKIQTLVDYSSRRGRPSVRDQVYWFVAWPGLQANNFFGKDEAPAAPSNSEWLFAVSKTLLGVTLFVASRWIIGQNLIAGGWLTMAGIIFAFHFGCLHLVALAWRRVGRNVAPIMNAPILATSISEFWSRRWNRAFRDFAHSFVLRPSAKYWNMTTATWLSFGFSGLVHELAISLPAGAGYGLPTCYFLLQALGLTVERWGAKRGIPIGNGIYGWCFALLFVIAPAYWLFHPPFVQNVIIPLIS
jgi:hypothetical protein